MHGFNGIRLEICFGVLGGAVAAGFVLDGVKTYDVDTVHGTVALNVGG